MKEYKLITAFNNITLDNMINKLFKEGWKCKGGVSVLYDSSFNLRYYQAMIRKPKKDKE
jgi:hypothetical protein